MNNELEGVRREKVVIKTKAHYGIYVGLRKATKYVRTAGLQAET
jgi:hypothetical protein